MHLRTVSVTACLKAVADGAVYDAMMRYPDIRMGGILLTAGDYVDTIYECMLY